jgi:group I intron endonuclease
MECTADINKIEEYRTSFSSKDTKRMSCIYMIRNPKCLIYIGQTKDLYKRYGNYKNAANSNRSQKILNSIKKYGFENHLISILHKCDVNELNFWEKFYIKLFSANVRECGLNLTSGGDSFEFNEEGKKKLSDAIKSNKEAIIKSTERIKEIHRKVASGEMAHPMKGRNHTKESIDKMSKTKSERIYAPRPKKVLSEETKEKLRKANLGKKQSPETIQKKKDAAKAFKESGRERKKSSFVWTEEQRNRWSEMCRGEKNGNYGKGMKDHVKERLREVNLGKKASEEVKKKMSLARKGVPKSEAHKSALRKPHKQCIRKDKTT